VGYSSQKENNKIRNDWRREHYGITRIKVDMSILGIWQQKATKIMVCKFGSLEWTQQITDTFWVLSMTKMSILPHVNKYGQLEGFNYSSHYVVYKIRKD